MDLLKNKTKTGSRYDKLRVDFLNLSFNAGIAFILEHLELLRTPLIFDYQNLMIGFNEEEIRKFLSKEYRNLKLQSAF